MLPGRGNSTISKSAGGSICYIKQNPDNALKHFLLAFLIALVGYAVLYQWIEQRRANKGPWRVTFGKTATGDPALLIEQPRLSITNVQLVFSGQAVAATNLPVTLIFDQPKPVPYDLPFGKCIFMDTTFLPGTLTLQLFGHEIELLPRILIIDHAEHPWKPGETIRLSPSGTNG